MHKVILHVDQDQRRARGGNQGFEFRHAWGSLSRHDMFPVPLSTSKE